MRGTSRATRRWNAGASAGTSLADPVTPIVGSSNSGRTRFSITCASPSRASSSTNTNTSAVVRLTPTLRARPFGRTPSTITTSSGRSVCPRASLSSPGAPPASEGTMSATRVIPRRGSRPGLGGELVDGRDHVALLLRREPRVQGQRQHLVRRALGLGQRAAREAQHFVRGLQVHGNRVVDERADLALLEPR